MLLDATAWWPALVFYALFLYWIVDAGLYQSLGFTKREVLIVFHIKLVWCVAYAVFHWLFFHGGDTFVVFKEAAQVNKALHRDPIDFLVLEFLPNHWYIKESLHHYNHALHMYGSESTWLMVRLNALFYLMSFGSYPAHLVMFSFATLPATLCLLRFMISHASVSKVWSYVTVLAFPAVAFWCNGMHKEAMILSGAGFAFYALATARDSGWTWPTAMLLLCGFVLLLSRSYMPLLLAPPMLAVYFSKSRLSGNAKLVTVGAIALVTAVGLFRLTRTDLWQVVLEKQQSFARESNASVRGLNALTWSDAPRWLATLAERAFVSPLPRAGFDWKGLPLFLMNVAVLLLPVVTFRRFDTTRFRRLGIWFVGAAVLNFLMIGALVPQAAAIGRYKAPMLVFLVFGWYCSITNSLWKQKS